MRHLLCFFALLVLAAGIEAGEPPSVVSPDGNIELRFGDQADASGLGAAKFQIRFQGQPLLTCDPRLRIPGNDLLEHATQNSSSPRKSDSTYKVLFGKSNPVRDHYSELTLDLATGAQPIRKLQLVFRAYDDGIAFRYVIPKQDSAESIEIADEPDQFTLAGEPELWPLYRENYTTSHEGLYVTENVSKLATNRLIDLPLLAQYANGVSVALTEANLRNYAGMYLKAEGEFSRRHLIADFAPLPGENGIKVRSSLPLSSPWRVILIGTSAARLFESNLILNLNEPSVLGDASWLKIGKSTWYWWNGPYQEPVDFKCDLNWETMKHYIDFSARNNIAFHSIMSTVDEFPWYFQTQRGYGPGPDSDVSKPRAGLEMERIVSYAKTKNVGIRLWVHWKPLSERLEEAFTQYEKWGVQGLMVDFLDRDDQEMVLFAERVLQSAARHHLHIHFHGVWKPTGLQRTYPNLFNHEGVLNLEYLKWGNECSPEHNLTVAFTRLLAGPMDYHLGGFRSVNRNEFKPQMIKPTVLGTRCHHLAMYVAFENPMPMVCDAPTAYEGQPGFDFIREVPTTWDETRVLDGKVGDYIIVARRNGAEWYVGAMTDWTARELELPLGFLAPGAYDVETWTDTAGSDDPNRLTQQKRSLSPTDKLTLRLSSGGGEVIRIQPKVR